MSDTTNSIQDLIEKAAKTEKSEDAMRFAQAALNASQAAHNLANLAQDKA